VLVEDSFECLYGFGTKLTIDEKFLVRLTAISLRYFEWFIDFDIELLHKPAVTNIGKFVLLRDF
jgi:hypothetical protein